MLLFSALLTLFPVLGLAQKNPFVERHGDTCTVLPVGGGGDDGPNILAAFAACGQNGRIKLPSYYSVNTVLNTTGLKNVEIELTGTLQYTPNIAYWSPNSIYLVFQNVTTFWLLGGTNIHLYGGGTIDGNGQVWYDALANGGTIGTAGGDSLSFARPVPLTIYNSEHVLVEHLTYLNSPNWHNFVYGSSYVEYGFLKMTSLSYSINPAKNTDGWDIYRSDHVTIHDCDVVNDDDCVSFKPNSTYMNVYNMFCNGSHGISVGSLGQYAGETDIVANVYVNNITMINAENGARIKVFGGSPDPNSTAGGGTGYVKNITFSNFYVNNVDYPITTDQCYFTDAAACAEYPSQLSISDVHYINVTGISSGAENATVVTLDCSQPCTDITAVGTNLMPPARFGSPVYVCSNITSESQLDFTCSA